MLVYIYILCSSEGLMMRRLDAVRDLSSAIYVQVLHVKPENVVVPLSQKWPLGQIRVLGSCYLPDQPLCSTTC